MIELTLTGPPVPWTPSRVVGGKYAFSPRYREKEHAQWEIRNQYSGPFLEGPICLEFFFEMSIPTSISKKKRMRMQYSWHLRRPDCSNCTKFAEDCLIGIVIKDDNQVCKIFAEKRYSETPKTVIRIHQL